MKDFDAREHRERMSSAAEAPKERTEIVWHQYSIQHKWKPQSAKDIRISGKRKSDWWTSWAGRVHRGDDPVESARHRLKADKVLDITYDSKDTWAGTRLLCKIEVVSVEVTVIPAMWEEQDDTCAAVLQDTPLHCTLGKDHALPHHAMGEGGVLVPFETKEDSHVRAG